MQEDAAGPAAEQTPEQTPLAGARLDELLSAVLTRVTGVLDAQERLRGLLDAVVGIDADLSLESALERIVTAACTLADAEYGALGVLGGGPGRRLRAVRDPRAAPTQRAAIGDLPRGPRHPRAASSTGPSRCGCPSSASTPRRTASRPTTRR